MLSDREQLNAWIASRQDYFGLPGCFYSEPQIYRAEIDAIWRQGWVFAGHACQIPRPGDFFTLRIDNDSLLVARGDDHEIRCFHNLCRHRGTLLCDGNSGHARRFVCPYHQWTYDPQGELVSCRGMPDDFPKHDWGLSAVPLRDLEGFLFISLASSPTDFSEALEQMGPLLRPQGFRRAKVAATADYQVHANWKIVWENNRECYHCNANHPQYIRANFDHYNRDDTTSVIATRIQAAVARSQAKWESQGLAASHRETGMASFPDPHGKQWFAANRTVLADGYLSETMTGQPVAPLMGDYCDTDVGTLRIRTMPNMWNHSSCDHSVTTRLLPAGPHRTDIQVTWLVSEDAEEGRDYDVEQLKPFWQLTSEQDWELCERAQQGVLSSGYRPGPLSPFKEYNLDAFFRWYLQQLRTL